MSSSAEDALCACCIQTVRRFEAESNEIGDDISAEIEVEKHYNYYGDRGVADLFVRETNNDSGIQYDHVYEFKSDAAIKDSTGANEILRQFNRLCTYFYKDENIDLPKTSGWGGGGAVFELAFNATETAYEHVMENLHLYQTISVPEVGSSLRDGRSLVTFRSESSESPVIVATSGDSDEFNQKTIAEMFKREYPDVLGGGVSRDE